MMMPPLTSAQRYHLEQLLDSSATDSATAIAAGGRDQALSPMVLGKLRRAALVESRTVARTEECPQHTRYWLTLVGAERARQERGQ